MKISNLRFASTVLLLFSILMGTPLFLNADSKEIGKLLSKKWPKENDTASLVDLLNSSKDTKDFKKSMLQICQSLNSENPMVFRAAYNTLEECADKKVYTYLAIDAFKKIKKKSPASVAVMDLLLKSPNSNDWKICLKFIKSKNRAVATVAAELAGRGCREAVPHLIKALKKAEGRHLTIICQSLDQLTGKDFGRSPSRWKSWWEDHKDNFDKTPLTNLYGSHLSEKPKGNGGPSYYGIPLEKANIFFAMDTSNSMKPDEPADKTTPPYDLKSSRFPPLPSGNGSKIWQARRELANLIQHLPSKGYKFGISSFGGNVGTWNNGKLHDSATSNRLDAFKWILHNTPLSFGTLLYQGMKVGFDDPEVEVVYLLTDGAPFPSVRGGGKTFKEDDPTISNSIVHMDWILALCRQTSICQRVLIHTISLGDITRTGIKQPMQPVKFLKRMAKENGGTFKVAKLGK